MRVCFLGLGDAWGAATPANHAKEACIKELGSYLLQVNKLQVNCTRVFGRIPISVV